MHDVLPTPRIRNPWRLSWLAGVLLFLSACGTLEAPVDDGEFAYLATLDIAADAVRADVEGEHDGTVIVFRPEAGFAVLGFTERQRRLTTLSVTPNLDAFDAPEVMAQGYTAWAGGYTAWAGGYTAWAGGWTAWAGGWTAWAGGGAVPAPPVQNAPHWEQIRLDEAHAIATTFGEGAVVAVIDSGVDLTHPGVVDQLAPATQWIDYVDGDLLPDDEPGGSGYGHGTGAAGIVLQVAPRATILPIRVLAPDGSGDLDDVVLAIDHAVAVGADVINLSLGAGQSSAPLEQMLQYAASQGVYVVASAGNNGLLNGVTYPARLTDAVGLQGFVFGVGSVGEGDVLSPFSNHGQGLFGVAPGENIFSLYPDARTGFYSGTSFAGPLYAGALALALSELPAAADPAALHGYLDAGLDKGDVFSNNATSAASSTVGRGRLDVAALLRALPGWSDPATPNTLDDSAYQRVAAGIQALYGFDGGGATVSDVSGVGTPLDLTIADPSRVSWLPGGGLSVNSATLISSAGAATKVITAVEASGAITLEAWVRPSSTGQSGPARIVTLSQDPYARNFTLGQDGSRYDARLRTTATSLNGMASTRTDSGALGVELTHVVYTRDASGLATIFLNGMPVMGKTVGGTLSNWNEGYRLALANELSENRAWLGELHLVGIYDRALDLSEVRTNFGAGPRLP